MSQKPVTSIDERRRSTRFAKERGTEEAVIWHPDREAMLVDVHDESLGGLSVYVADVSFFAVGQRMEIIYAGEFTQARVRHVEPCDDGGYIVGLACQRRTAAWPW